MAADVTYGSSLAALQFAHQNNTKIVINEPSFPLEFEDKSTHHAWALLYTKLMLDGKTIGGDSVEHSRINDDYLFVVCKSNVVNKVEFDKLFIFCDKKISGLPETIRENDIYKIIDFMAPISLTVDKQKNIIKTADLFVSEINILKKYRTAPIQIYVISTLTKKQLNEFDYSDTMAKFKSESLLEEYGFKGTSIGGRKPPITLEVQHRQVNKQMDFYEDTDKIKFIYGS